MGNGRWSGYCCAWRRSQSSSSTKLLLFMLPLLFVAGLISVLGPNASTWVVVANKPLLVGSVVTLSSSPSYSTSGGDVATIMEAPVTVSSEVKEGEGLVVVAVDAHGKEEKAISDDTAFSHSSTPPLPVQAIQMLAQSVRDSFLLILILKAISHGRNNNTNNKYGRSFADRIFIKYLDDYYIQEGKNM